MKKYLSFLLIILAVSFFPPVQGREEIIPPFEQDFLQDDHISLIPQSVPVTTTRSLGPVLSAKAVIAIDIDSGIILFEKNMYQRLPIASLTKIMTILVTLDITADILKTVLIPQEVNTIPPSKMNLLSGDEVRIKDLMEGSLIHSANDAAYVLSTLDKDFIPKMNDKVAVLGLEDTHFSNAIGWDEDGNYSSAYDMSKLMRYALQYPLVYDAISTKEKTIVSEKGITYIIKSTNKLFDSFLDIIGGKTGTTDGAGPSFINIFRTSNGHRVLTVLLNSPDRFTETKILSYWVMKNFEWK